MAVAEVAVTGLDGVGGPGAAALVAEIVVDFLLGDDDDFFLTGGASEEALVDEGSVWSGLVVVGGGYLGGELVGVRPEAGGVRGVPRVDGGFVVDGVVGGVLAASGWKERAGEEGGGAKCLVEGGHRDQRDSHSP